MQRDVTAISHGAGLLALCTTLAMAEPVEVRQGSEVGGGTTYRKGETCLVLTARHVVKESGMDVRVFDRSGNSTEGQRAYDNPHYDLALVRISSTAGVACTEKWPAKETFSGFKPNSSMRFEAIRHTPSGRESLIHLRLAGGTNDTISLAPVDRRQIAPTDSGSMVLTDGKAVGIVQSVNMQNDRVEVLRFDVIEHLVGKMFRSVGKSAVQLEGVFSRGRLNANWSAYLREWVLSVADRPVVGAQDASAKCRIKVNVLEWKTSSAKTADYEALEAQRRACSSYSGRARSSCQSDSRELMRETPRSEKNHHLQFEIFITSKAGTVESKLGSAVVTTNAKGSVRAESELQVLNAAIGPTAQKLFESGICD